MFWTDAKPSIWTRSLARAVDYGAFYLLCSFFSMVFPFYIEDMCYLGFALILPALWAPIEAILISRTKTTLGKALFGIRVETHLAEKLPFGISLKRALFLGRRPGIIRRKKVGVARVLLGFTILCSLLGGSYFEKEIACYTTGFEKYRNIEGWKEYTSTDGKFSVNFPEEPSHESGILPVPSQKKNLNYDEFKSFQTKKVYYSVSYIELPKKWKMAGANRLLKGALELMVKDSPETVLLNKNMTKHRNLRALDYHLTQGEDEVQGRLVLVGTTLFRLTAVYPPSLAHQLQHDEFVDSFMYHG